MLSRSALLPLVLAAPGCGDGTGAPELRLPRVADVRAEAPPRLAPVPVRIDARGVATFHGAVFAIDSETGREALVAALRKALAAADRAHPPKPEPRLSEDRAALSLGADAGLPARRVEGVLVALGRIGPRWLFLETEPGEAASEERDRAAVRAELPFRGIDCPPHPPDPLVVCGLSGRDGAPALVLHRWHAEPLDDYDPEMLGGRVVGSMTELLALCVDAERAWLHSTADARWEDTVRVAAALRRSGRSVLFRGTHSVGRPAPEQDRAGELAVLRLPELGAATPPVGSAETPPADAVVVQIGADEVAEHAGRRATLRSERQLTELAVALAAALRRADREQPSRGPWLDPGDGDGRASLLVRADARAPAAAVERLLRALATSGPRAVHVATSEGADRAVRSGLPHPKGVFFALPSAPPPLVVVGPPDRLRGEPSPLVLYRWELDPDAANVPVGLPPIELGRAAEAAAHVRAGAQVRVQSLEEVRWERTTRVHVALRGAGLRSLVATGRDLLAPGPR